MVARCFIRFVGVAMCALMLTLSVGCSKAKYGVIQDDWIIAHKDIKGKLTGPYIFRNATAPHEIRVEVNTNEFVRITLRGLKETGHHVTDHECKDVMGPWLRSRPIYLLTDTIRSNANGMLSGIVLVPAEQSGSFDTSDGHIERHTETYELIPHSQLSLGLALADRTDTNYWVYPSLLAAENQAKLNRKGYWAEHKQPLAQTTSNGVSNMTTNK